MTLLLEFSPNSSGITSAQEPTQDPRLPLDVLGVIAHHLIASDLFATCAALNTTCKAVKEETNRTLWRSFLGWGCGVYDKLTCGLEGIQGDPEETRQEREYVAQEQWEFWHACPAAHWIGYLYRPFADFEAGWVAMTPTTEATRWRKATIEVDDMPHMLGAGTFHPSIFATLFNGYDYGTGDVFGLFDALATVWRLGNHKIQAALRGPNGICVIPKASQSPDVPYDPKDVAIKTALARLGSAVYRPQELRPDNITVRAIEEIPIRSIMLCLLDVMFWLKAAGAPGHVDVCVFDSRLETAEAYVKILQRAFKKDPKLATSGFVIMLSLDTVPDDLTTRTTNIVAALRGMLLKTPRSQYADPPPVFPLQMTLPDNRFITWTIQLDPPNRQVVTWMYASGGVRQVMYRDTWDRAN